MAFEILGFFLVVVVAFALVVLNWVVQRALTENRDFAKHLLDENRELVRLLAVRGNQPATSAVIHQQQMTENRPHQPVFAPEPLVEAQY